MIDNIKHDELNQIPYFKRLILLFLIFFKLGVVNFGGGYALLPLLSRELVDKRHWSTNSELADYYAVGQCTPGAIAVNVSTFIGYKVAGILGGFIATLAFVSPAFIIIFVIAFALSNFNDNPFVINALAGINVAVFVLILSAIVKLSKNSIVDIWTLLIAVGVAILSIFVKVVPLYVYIIIAALLGVLIKYILEKKKEPEYKPIVKEEDISEENSNNITEEINEPKISITKNDVLMFIFGFLVGAIVGLFGIISLFFIKNKKYRNGLIVSSFFWVIIGICLLVSLITNNYIFFNIYFNFFRIGFCAFGGGLATLPFLEELGIDTGWFNQEQLTAMLAVSESTPGAMGINMSTYVGYTVSLGCYDNYFLAFLGSIISTLGLVSSSIIVILIVSLFLQKFNSNKYVKWVFYGLRAASIGLICAAAYSVLKVSIFGVIDPLAEVKEHYDLVSAFKATIDYYKVNDGGNFFSFIYKYFDYLFEFKALALGLFFGIIVFKFKKHPIFYIVLGAMFGILLQLGNASL